MGGLLGGILMIATGESVEPIIVDDRCIFLIQEEGGFGFGSYKTRTKTMYNVILVYSIMWKIDETSLR